MGDMFVRIVLVPIFALIILFMPLSVSIATRLLLFVTILGLAAFGTQRSLDMKSDQVDNVMIFSSVDDVDA